MKTSNLLSQVLVCLFFILGSISESSAQASQLWGTTTNGGNGGGVIFHVNGGGELYSKAHSFIENSGALPQTIRLVEYSDTRLYGTTYAAGGSQFGVIFRYHPGSGDYEVIHSFEGVTTGEKPDATLMLGSDDKFYGLASSGGTNAMGCLFRIDPVTLEYEKLWDFDGMLTGNQPTGSLVEDEDGVIYGSTAVGGTNNFGVIFSFDISTDTYAKLHDFDLSTGIVPWGGMTLSDGDLFGMTTAGANGMGVIYRFDLDSNSYTVEQNFSGTSGNTEGANPYGDLIMDANGDFYGMTYSGGANNTGVIFKYSLSGPTYSKLHDFNNSSGEFPSGSLLLDNNVLYGITERGGANDLGVLFSIDTNGSNYTNLDDFDGSGNGSYPLGSLTKHSNGSLYGAATFGGSGVGLGNGKLFSSGFTSGSLTGLLNFNTTLDGSYPVGELVEGNGGLLYGVTRDGGNTNEGTIYSINPVTNDFSNEYDLTNATGTQPVAGLCLLNSKLYGQTTGGGSLGFGTVFSFDPSDNSVTTIHPYTGGGNDGQWGTGPLIYANSRLYGMTKGGGLNSQGTIFEIAFGVSPNHSTVYSFDGTLHGSAPEGGLIDGGGGILYGMTSTGGANGGGVIFEFNTLGNSLTVLHDLNNQLSEGFQPLGDLLLASDGFLYGLTFSGGDNTSGTMFKVDPSNGDFTKLFDFGGSMGTAPPEGLVEADNGRLYGLTNTGGANGIGVLFEYDPVGDAFTVKKDLNGTSGFYPVTDLLSLPCTPSASTFDINACSSYTSPSGQVLTESGSFQDIILSATGCDSIITINLTVDNLDLNVLNNDPQLLATPIADSYQWLDCNEDYAPIAGETDPVFNAPEPGVYACLLSYGACQDTTLCTTVFNVSIEDLEEMRKAVFSVYPNPTQGLIQVEWAAFNFYALELLDENGRSIRRWSDPGEMNQDKGQLVLDLGDLAPGIYTIRANGRDGIQRKLVVIPK